MKAITNITNIYAVTSSVMFTQQGAIIICFFEEDYNGFVDPFRLKRNEIYTVYPQCWEKYNWAI